MTDEKKYGMMTKALHSGWSYDPATGAFGLPIFMSSAFQFRSTEHAANLFNLEEEGFIYSRISNPTVNAFEEGLNALENGSGCLATSSGQAGIDARLALSAEPPPRGVAHHRVTPQSTSPTALHASDFPAAPFRLLTTGGGWERPAPTIAPAIDRPPPSMSRCHRVTVSPEA